MDDTAAAIDGICAKDSRYRQEGYAFVLAALEHALKSLGRRRHLTGQELSEAVRSLALEHYGMMAKTVLASWGCAKTADFGNIVYNMIAAGIMSKTEQDDIRDFHAVYDFEEAFGRYQFGSGPELENWRVGELSS